MAEMAVGKNQGALVPHLKLRLLPKGKEMD